MANPDIILYNGRVYPTLNPEKRVQAIAVSNGRVVSTGNDENLLKLNARSVQRVDLAGRTAIPGLSDSHIHLLGYGTLLRTLDLGGARSILDLQRSVERFAGTRPKGSWVLGRGWDQEKLVEQRYPRSEDLDIVSQPVFLTRVCGHVGVANRLALSLAGIDRATLDPSGGIIERGPDGEPTGLLKENALALVDKAIPLDVDETEQALEEAATRLLALGLTSLHCIVANELEFKALQRLKEQDKIQQSIYPILPLEMLERFSPSRTALQAGKGLRVGGVKVYIDGSLGARTAALSEPYSDDPTNGIVRVDSAELEEIGEKAAKIGLQMCLHAIGDRAVQQAVSAIERANSVQPGLRHRVEHASLTNPKLVQRMRRAGVVASVQPRFIFSDSWAVQRLGVPRAEHLYAFRSMLDAGIVLAAGSDCPVEDPNPFEGIWSAVARPGLSQREALTVGEVLSCYTTGAAFASHSEKLTGTLETGKRADMVVLNVDPFECSANELRSINVVQSFVEGRQTLPNTQFGDNPQF